MDSTASASARGVLPLDIPIPLEVRVHGRGGQGGVTCARLLATVYAELGLHVQTFGDYGSERSGAPIRAFTRVDTAPIKNHNKVYQPHHLVVLDAGLLGDDLLDGADAGSTVLLNTARGLAPFADRHGHYRFAAVDATSIARRHGIGTSAVVIINTTLAGAYARVMGLPWHAVEAAFAHQGLTRDLPAAREAWEAVEHREAEEVEVAPRPPPAPAPVIGIAEHVQDIPTPLQTGAWRTQVPLYRSHAAPCNATCPAGNDVVGFVQALARGGVEAAARILLATQPLPSVCGRVCPAPCMTACNRATYDGAVNVRALERWVGDHHALAVDPPAPATPRRRVAVVGGGPAGLAAAFALARAGHGVEIFEQQPQLGGVLRNGIPAYRLPPEALDRDLARILALGVEVHAGETLDAPRVADLAATFDGMVVATGLQRVTGLDVPGADLPGVREGIAFLDAVRRGGAPRLSGHVVVAGGGNTAVDCARTALRLGAASVAIAYRRGRREMPAIAGEVEEAVQEGARLLLFRQPVRVLGGDRVESLELAEVELGEPDASGRRRPVVTGRTASIPCDHLLLALGQGPDRTLVPGLPNVVTAGDVATGDGTVTHAIGSGRRAAERLLARLEGRPEPVEPAIPEEALVTPAHVRFSHFDVEPPRRERHAVRTFGPDAGPGAFDEVNRGLDGPAEAARCFSCGHCTSCETCLLYCPEGVIRHAAGGGYDIDLGHCKGCGMCVAECPRRAMEMVQEAGAR